ncbi:hypothetical protein [Hansschlegelia zhihuaiae]|uniref:Uncharacterized protein n=1 Tax=Hansschlegelia zhihuaiae TaxID=405005 RepID=A0A4Q0M4K5_9HYPH|nr:hypothetical protein [Hansschlegelia zhihuaiae]RXF67835.1 hypothetical protein EK403_20915 [Hansschlegelia zhihuaiae]
MATISVGQAMEIIAEQAADYAAAGKPDLDDRVRALADSISAAVDGPTMNAPRFFASLFERLDAATEATSSPKEGRRDQPAEDELYGQHLFFAAMAHQFRLRLEAAAA